MLMKRIASTLALWLLYVPLAHAQDLGAGKLDEVAGAANIKGQTSLPVLIGNLVRIAIGLLGIVFLVLTIYAGFLYLTARGEEEKVKHAKETLSRGVIGLLIISAAYAIATFVITALTTATKAAP
jgi:type IV secretion system pilin